MRAGPEERTPDLFQQARGFGGETATGSSTLHYAVKGDVMKTPLIILTLFRQRLLVKPSRLSSRVGRTLYRIWTRIDHIFTTAHYAGLPAATAPEPLAVHNASGEISAGCVHLGLSAETARRVASQLTHLDGLRRSSAREAYTRFLGICDPTTQNLVRLHPWLRDGIEGLRRLLAHSIIVGSSPSEDALTRCTSANEQTETAELMELRQKKEGRRADILADDATPLSEMAATDTPPNQPTPALSGAQAAKSGGASPSSLNGRRA